MSDYDGNLPGRWDQCPWQPRPIRKRMTLIKIQSLRQLAYEIQESKRQQLRDQGHNV